MGLETSKRNYKRNADVRFKREREWEEGHRETGRQRVGNRDRQRQTQTQTQRRGGGGGDGGGGANSLK